MQYTQPVLAPSLLSADFTRLGDEVQRIEAAGAQRLHLDIMDGQFVPNISFGPAVLRALRPHYTGYFDAHLMLAHPEQVLQDYAQAGCNGITVHVEAVLHVLRVIAHIKSLNMHAGIAILPATSLASVVEILPHIDLLLVMLVNPGFSGQNIIPEVLPKIKALHEERRKRGLHFLISVDGGVTSQNAGQLIHLGANIVVSGSEFFTHDAPHEFVNLVASFGSNAGGKIV